MWLDRGELDKVIERSRADLGAAQARGPVPAGESPLAPHPHAERDDEYYRPKRRKSFLEDLFG